jgi:transcriptional regulatory protein RtcR
VLLIGATGVGKSKLARRIYELKVERQLLTGKFIEVNCATLRGSHSMSALFGHTKGSFTGATEARAGYLRAADGGMLFLDEIGELGLDKQAMLLRAIEEKRFQPVGSDTDVVSNFQLIAGTNRDLDIEVSAGKFREDLLARINLWTFRLPSLAERREDIEPNVEYELAEYERQHQMKIGFSKEARKRFLDFAVSHEAAWNANFRDLNAAIVRMATLSSGGRISIETVEKEIARLEKQWKKASQGVAREWHDILGRYFDEQQIDQIDLFDRVQLAEVIRVCQDSSTLTEAGRRLFQYSRTQKNSTNDASRLRKYLARFGLNWERIKEY